MAAPNPRSRPDSHGGVLPLPADALYEVLLRVPTKDLCRLRAVCRPWRCLLSDPHFVAAHAARHPEPPLIIAGYHTALRDEDDRIVYDIVDLSGRAVKRVRAMGDDYETGGDEWVRSIFLGFICISSGKGWNFQLRNLATGAVCVLPDPEGYISEAALGQVPSTGEYKVLRVIDHCIDYEGQLYEVFTLTGGSSARRIEKKPIPRNVNLDLWQNAVVNGIAYFFYDAVQAQYPALDRIASFDLGMEEWMASLRGPLSSLVDAAVLPRPQFGTNELTMVALNGCLVVVHRCFTSRMDLWFLTLKGAYGSSNTAYKFSQLSGVIIYMYVPCWC